MSLLRTSTASLRAVAPRASAPVAVRFNSTGPGGHQEGATSTSKGWGDREKSQEAAYVRQAEAEKIRKLQETIKKQREHLDEVDKALNDLSGPQKK